MKHKSYLWRSDDLLNSCWTVMAHLNPIGTAQARTEHAFLQRAESFVYLP